MRTRLARLLLAAARRLDPHVGRILHPQAKVAWGDPVPRSRDEVDKAVASMEYVRQRYGLASGGRILGPARDEDTAGPFKLSECCDRPFLWPDCCAAGRAQEQLLREHRRPRPPRPFKLSEGGPVSDFRLEGERLEQVGDHFTVRHLPPREL